MTESNEDDDFWTKIEPFLPDELRVKKWTSETKTLSSGYFQYESYLSVYGVERHATLDGAQAKAFLQDPNGPYGWRPMKDTKIGDNTVYGLDTRAREYAKYLRQRFKNQKNPETKIPETKISNAWKDGEKAVLARIATKIKDSFDALMANFAEIVSAQSRAKALTFNDLPEHERKRIESRAVAEIAEINRKKQLAADMQAVSRDDYVESVQTRDAYKPGTKRYRLVFNDLVDRFSKEPLLKMKKVSTLNEERKALLQAEAQKRMVVNNAKRISLNKPAYVPGTQEWKTSYQGIYKRVEEKFLDDFAPALQFKVSDELQDFDAELRETFVHAGKHPLKKNDLLDKPELFDNIFMSGASTVHSRLLEVHKNLMHLAYILVDVLTALAEEPTDWMDVALGLQEFNAEQTLRLEWLLLQPTIARLLLNSFILEAENSAEDWNALLAVPMHDATFSIGTRIASQVLRWFVLSTSDDSKERRVGTEGFINLMDWLKSSMTGFYTELIPLTTPADDDAEDEDALGFKNFQDADFDDDDDADDGEYKPEEDDDGFDAAVEEDEDGDKKAEASVAAKKAAPIPVRPKKPSEEKKRASPKRPSPRDKFGRPLNYVSQYANYPPDRTIEGQRPVQQVVRSPGALQEFAMRPLRKLPAGAKRVSPQKEAFPEQKPQLPPSTAVVPAKKLSPADKKGATAPKQDSPFQFVEDEYQAIEEDVLLGEQGQVLDMKLSAKEEKELKKITAEFQAPDWSFSQKQSLHAANLAQLPFRPKKKVTSAEPADFVPDKRKKDWWNSRMRPLMVKWGVVKGLSFQDSAAQCLAPDVKDAESKKCRAIRAPKASMFRFVLQMLFVESERVFRDPTPDNWERLLAMVVSLPANARHWKEAMPAQLKSFLANAFFNDDQTRQKLWPVVTKAGPENGQQYLLQPIVAVLAKIVQCARFEGKHKEVASLVAQLKLWLSMKGVTQALEKYKAKYAKAASPGATSGANRSPKKVEKKSSAHAPSQLPREIVPINLPRRPSPANKKRSPAKKLSPVSFGKAQKLVDKASTKTPVMSPYFTPPRPRSASPLPPPKRFSADDDGWDVFDSDPGPIQISPSKMSLVDLLTRAKPVYKNVNAGDLPELPPTVPDDEPEQDDEDTETDEDLVRATGAKTGVGSSARPVRAPVATLAQRKSPPKLPATSRLAWNLDQKAAEKLMTGFVSPDWDAKEKFARVSIDKDWHRIFPSSVASASERQLALAHAKSDHRDWWNETVRPLVVRWGATDLPFLKPLPAQCLSGESKEALKLCPKPGTLPGLRALVDLLFVRADRLAAAKTVADARPLWVDMLARVQALPEGDAWNAEMRESTRRFLSHGFFHDKRVRELWTKLVRFVDDAGGKRPPLLALCAALARMLTCLRAGGDNAREALHKLSVRVKTWLEKRVGPALRAPRPVRVAKPEPAPRADALPLIRPLDLPILSADDEQDDEETETDEK